MKESNQLASVGTAMPGLSANRLKGLLFPLPPYQEQHHIVSKLKEVIPYVERFGETEDALSRLNSEIRVYLKKSILQESIQGKLVLQNALDEPVSALLQRIKEEKQRLVKEGKLKKKDVVDSTIFRGDDNRYYEQIGKTVTDITDEIPFEIPESWEWCRISQCCERIFSGKSPIYSKTPTKHMIIGQQANQWERIEMQYVKYGTEEYANKIEEYQYLLDGDVLLNSLGNGTLGRCGIFESITERVLTDGHLLVFRTISKALAKYILFYLTVNYTEINKNADGSTNQTFLNLSKVSKYLIPLPPIKEIERIVIKKEELYAQL